MPILGHNEPHPTTGTKTWTREEEEKLLELRTKGLSSREMAIEMGKTRMAILGKLHRMKLNVAADEGRRTLKKKKSSFKFEPMPDRGSCMWHTDGEGWCRKGSLPGKAYCQHHHQLSQPNPPPKPLNEKDVLFLAYCL